MPEFMGHKITRAEEKARHAFRRKIDGAIRQAAKGGGWRSAQGVLFQNRNGWFVEVMPAVTIYWRETSVSLKVKPMGVDPIFWELVDTPENLTTPLSFRAFGAWTCPSVELVSAHIDEGEMDAEGTAARIVAWATREAILAEDGLTLETFIERLKPSPGSGNKGGFIATLVSALLLGGQLDNAEDVCRDAIARGWNGGFLIPGGTFTQVALDRIEARRRRAIN